MKTICLLILSICFSLVSFAQLKKGNNRLGAQIANLNYGLRSKVLSVSVNPSFSHFVSDKILLGIQFSYSSNTELGKSSSKDNFRAIGIGANSRQYLFTNKSGGLFLEEMVSMNFLNGNGFDGAALGISLSPGYSIILNKSITFDNGAGWMGYLDLNDIYDAANIGLNLGLSIYLGNKDKTDNK